METRNKTLAELAGLVGGRIEGDPELVICGLADIATAAEGEIAFITKANRSAEIGTTRASAVIVPMEVASAPKPIIQVKDPYLAAALIHNELLAQPFIAAGIDATAVIGSDCRIPAEVSIGPLSVLGNRVTFGKRVCIHPGVVIGDDVTIGDDGVIYPNVTIYKGCRIGDRVIIHSGTAVGSDGFGYATDERGLHVKRPHVGIVQIDDDVEIGANVCIDRATFGKTWIKRGVKIDNLVQVAHNVVVGEDSLLVSQVGIAGSATLGRNVVLGGQAGVKGHIRLEDRVMVAAKAGVTGNVEKGAVISGYPAVAHGQWLKASTIFARLPQMYQELRELKKLVRALQEERCSKDESGGRDA